MASKSGSSPSLSPLPDEEEGEGGDENLCNICNEKYCEPRILSCLHVFCKMCLTNLLEEEEEAAANGDSDGEIHSHVIVCPVCRQDTKVSKHGACSLPPDYVSCRPKERSSPVEKQTIVCTSCKTKETAVARCNDCTSFLCTSCVSAHQFMRCFENHKVVFFADMTDNPEMDAQKYADCPSHASESIKYFCQTCQFPVCNECLVDEHKPPEHRCLDIVEAEKKQRDELENLMSESKGKVQFCEDASITLESLLSDLQMHSDTARSQIEETFQSCKAVLEKIRDDNLTELENQHKVQELKVMDTINGVEKTMEKIEYACKFTNRLLTRGDTSEILLLKGVVGSQLLYLINNSPKPDVTVCLEFETDLTHFEKAARDSFGHIKRPSEPSKDTTVQSSLHSSFDSEGFVLPAGVLTPEVAMSCGGGGGGRPSSVVEMSTNGYSDFTLSQLASIADMAAAAAHSPTSPLSLADLMSNSDSLVTSSHTLNNLTALAKLGSVSLGNHQGGQLLLNGHGLNLDGCVHSGPPSSNSPNGLLQPNGLGQTLDAATASALGALLNGGLSSPHDMSSRGASPSMDSMSGSQLALANSLLGNGGDLISPFGSSSGFGSPRGGAAKLNPVKIRYKFGQLGPGKGQFSSPHGFCLGVEEEIVVADTNNHRIQIFDKSGDFKYQFGIPGKDEGQLWYPRKVAIMRSSGKFVVCDRGNERSRMQIFSKNGNFIKKIAIRYIDIVAGLAITNQGLIVAVDSVSPTVFIIAESGDLIRWFDCSEFMREPSDIAINGKEFFVCDFKGHCVVVFNEDGTFARRIGCENITNYPNGIDISDAGDVLVGDSHGNRFHVAVFSRDGSLLSEFECPYVKVSRCCGLKITSEGFVVTLAKNNHHVLILSTLYIM